MSRSPAFRNFGDVSSAEAVANRASGVTLYIAAMICFAALGFAALYFAAGIG
jgi:hypothetical protein